MSHEVDKGLLKNLAPASSAVKLIAEGSPSCCSEEPISTVSRPTCKKEMHTQLLGQSISLQDYALSAYPCYSFFIDLVVSMYCGRQCKPRTDELFETMRKHLLVSDECAKLAARTLLKHQNSPKFQNRILLTRLTKNWGLLLTC